MDRKTVTVKEVAEALGLTTRGVRDRLTRGELKGIRKTNNFGVSEWRIYPTKEIADKLKLDDQSDIQANDFPAMEEPVDAELMGEEGAEATEHQSWVAEERSHMRLIAEEMMKPLLNTIREQERQIEDQSRQLKLLPDFQRDAELAQKKAMEQVMEAEAAAKQKAIELEIEFQQKQKESEEQIQKIKEEKENELKAVTEQVAALAQTIAELKQPWWKKMFSSPES